MKRESIGLLFVFFILFGCITGSNHVINKKGTHTNTTLNSKPRMVNVTVLKNTSKQKINSQQVRKPVKYVRLTYALKSSTKPVLCSVREQYVVTQKPSTYPIRNSFNQPYVVNYSIHLITTVLIIPSSHRIYIKSYHTSVVNRTFYAKNNKMLISYPSNYSFTSYLMYVVNNSNVVAYITPGDISFWYLYELPILHDASLFLNQTVAQEYYHICYNHTALTPQCTLFLQKLMSDNATKLPLLWEYAAQWIKNSTCDNYVVAAVKPHTTQFIYSIRIASLVHAVDSVTSNPKCGSVGDNGTRQLKVFLTSYAVSRSVNDIILVPKVPSNFTFTNVTYTKKALNADGSYGFVKSVISCRKVAPSDIRVNETIQEVKNHLGSNTCSILNVLNCLICQKPFSWEMDS